MVATMGIAQKRSNQIVFEKRLRSRSTDSWQLLFMLLSLSSVSYEAANKLDYAWLTQCAPCIGGESYLQDLDRLFLQGNLCQTIPGPLEQSSSNNQSMSTQWVQHATSWEKCFFTVIHQRLKLSKSCLIGNEGAT